MGILNKKDMSEEDIKLNFVTPALLSRGWKDKITMETKVVFTDGKVNLKGNVQTRGETKKADYVLYIDSINNPIAVVEAKDNKHSVSYGLQQAKEYAVHLDVPFAYSSNGDAFHELDLITGAEQDIPLDQFPTYDELCARFIKEKALSTNEINAMKQPYYTSQNTYGPRYYQRIAVNRTIDAIARGQNRILLAMATGTGKTYTAFQICYRLLESKMKKKILYLADRNFLVDQAIQLDFNPLEKVIHKINYNSEDPTTIGSYQVYFSLYQQLSEKDEDTDDDDYVSKLASLFSPTFFDLIIVDECHRGSVKKDGNWRKILDYFSSATQIGMTATPKETKYISNIDYFGKPIYQYSLKQGIEDGFLAPFRVINVKTNIGDGWRPCKGQKDIFGNEIEDRVYNNNDYDYNIVIQDRIYQVANEITDYLKATDRMQKTIVFCPTEAAAERMRIALVNLNQDKVRENPDYIVRITGSDVYGKSKLDYFISTSSAYPVIATTSKLLSTGADCKLTKLIVLDEMIGSMTEFKQIIGRGTRINEKAGKTSFTIMDFRNVTRLFADPDWDGPIEQDEDFDPNHKFPPTPPRPPVPPKEQPIIDEKGCSVKVTSRVVSIYDTDGKLLKCEDIIDYTKTNIVGKFASLRDFIDHWTAAEKKAEIKELLLKKGIDLDVVKADQGMNDVDDFDFICHVAFDEKPLTRKERAEEVKRSDFFSKYSGAAKEVLEALLEQYMNVGVYDIESPDVLKLSPINQYGTPSKIASLFGGKTGYLAAVKDLESKIYQIGA